MSQPVTVDTRNIEALLFALLAQKCGSLKEAKNLYADSKDAIKSVPKEPPTFVAPSLMG